MKIDRHFDPDVSGEHCEATLETVESNYERNKSLEISASCSIAIRK